VRLLSSELGEALLALFPVGQNSVALRMLGTGDEIDSVLEADAKRLSDGQRVIIVELSFPTRLLSDKVTQEYQIQVVVVERIGKKYAPVKVHRRRFEAVDGLLRPVLVAWCDDRKTRSTTGYTITSAYVSGGTFAAVPDLLARGWIAAGLTVTLTAKVES
jgi:hypothetical protein